MILGLHERKPSVFIVDWTYKDLLPAYYWKFVGLNLGFHRDAEFEQAQGQKLCCL